MNSSLKSVATVLALSLITSLSCFAQGHGVSGPDTQGMKTSTDELVLTRPKFQEILGGCMQSELLELSKVIAKNENLTLLIDANGYNSVETVKGLPSKGELVRVGRHFVQVGVYTYVQAFIELNDQRWGGNPMQFSINAQLNNTNKFVSFYSKTAPSLHYEEASLKDPQNPTADPIDELGNVIQDKIIVTNTSWLDHTVEGAPIDLNSPLDLYNSDSNVKVPGLTFNQARYIQCVNLKLGKYAPVAQ